MNFTTLANEDTITKTVAVLKNAGIESVVVENAAAAKDQVLKMLPQGAEVLTMSSETLRLSGIADVINGSEKFDSVRKKIETLNKKNQWSERQKLGAAPDWVIGSVHAVTTDGKIIIVSNTGSQLPAYASGASHVIWVIGTQKIVLDLDTAMKRIYEYVLPLENERAMKVYGAPSNVSKILIINREIQPGRITVVFVKEKLGF